MNGGNSCAGQGRGYWGSSGSPCVTPAPTNAPAPASACTPPSCYTQAGITAEVNLGGTISDGYWTCSALLGWKGATVCTNPSVQHYNWAQSCPHHCAQINGGTLGQGAPTPAPAPIPSATPCTTPVTLTKTSWSAKRYQAVLGTTTR